MAFFKHLWRRYDLEAELRRAAATATPAMLRAAVIAGLRALPATGKEFNVELNERNCKRVFLALVSLADQRTRFFMSLQVSQTKTKTKTPHALEHGENVLFALFPKSRYRLFQVVAIVVTYVASIILVWSNERKRR
jgi:hypothetical protein